ncbi:MAG: alginate export family protein [bacterium]
MKRIIFAILLLLLVLLHLIANAEEGKFKFNCQMRHRFEMDNRDFNGDTAQNDFNLLRTRVGLTFTPEDNLEAFVQIQDSRAFGEEANTLTDGSADNLDLHQAYFKIGNLFDLPIDLKVGRMEAGYGNERLIGAVGWSNIGRSFDGGVLTLHFEKFSLDFFNLKEQEMSALGDYGDRNVYGLHADFQVAAAHQTQAFLIWQQAKPVEALDRYTLGLYLKGKFGNFRHALEAAYQGGKLGGIDVSAYLLALNLGYTVAQSNAAPDFSVGVDYLSGDDDFADDTYKVFDTLYATNHKFYGFMDYFTNLPQHTYGRGLLDLHARLGLKPAQQWSVQAVLHVFNANQNFTLGASLFMPGKIFEETMGKDTSTWFYLMTLVNI